jgi:hypothetical protein
MFLRNAPDRTLATVLDSLESTPGTNIAAVGTNVSVALAVGGERTVRVNNIEVPFTESGLEALSGHLQVPKSFLQRSPSELQEHIFNFLLQRDHDESIYRVSEDGLLEVRSLTQKVVDPRAVIEIMQKTIDTDAPVIDFWATPESFRLDTIVPEGFDRGIGGDRPKGRQVGDLTRGGVRVLQNRKQNHAPELSEFYYRLMCTNGMEVQVEGDKIDARGQTVEEVLMEIELTAQRIMGRLEERIARFYNLREETVRTPEQAIYRMADERGISDRVATEIARVVPSITQDDGTATMFDLLNLVTNFANEPSIARRDGSRLLLERAAGAVVHEHAERCAHCQSKLLSA